VARRRLLTPLPAAGHRTGHRVCARLAGPSDPLLAAVEVAIARPDPPAALPGRDEPCPRDPASAPLRPATGVRHIPPAAVPAAVDPEGVGVPLDHAMTVERQADTPTEITDRAIRYGHAAEMARQHKGWAILTRLPAREEELIRTRATEQGLSYSDVIANAVAVGLGHPPIHEPRYSADDQDQLLAS